MADNIYLLETRLSREQQAALETIREVARSNGLTVFLVGGAVRDLISGTAVRDLDVAVQGDARKLKKELEKAGARLTGESDLWQSVFLHLPGGVRMEVASTLSVTYPKPGKPVVAPATILEDLRRRDFTANAMALSLNEGSYGLLMDPLNGVADMENRQLRLVSNYGFIESPVLLLRAARFMGRLGWTLEEKTQSRYETSKEEDYIAALDGYHRGYETEELFHEEDSLRVMQRLEEEGWLRHLSPALSPAKANSAEIVRLHDVLAQLQMQGITPDPAAISFPLVTAKLSADEVQALKKSFPRQGFVREIDSVETAGKEFAAQLTSKATAQPSQAYKLIRGSAPESVLWAAFYSKNAGVQAKFKSFYTEWPTARQRIPYTLMQEMRITPDLPGYEDLLEQIFYELMDGRLDTAEAMKAFLEPFSPPAPPPPVSLRRPRASKKDSKPSRSRKKAQVEDPEIEDAVADKSAPSEAAIVPEQPAAEAPAPVLVPQAPAAAAAEPAPLPAPTAVSSPTPQQETPKPAPAAKKAATPAPKPAGKAATAKVAAKQKPAGKGAAAEKAQPSAKAAPAKAPGKAATKPVPTKVAPAKPVAKGKPAAKNTAQAKPSGSAKAAAKAPPPRKAVKPPAKNAAPASRPAGKASPAKVAAKAKPATKKVPAKSSKAAAKQPAKPTAKGRR